jgi:hypothetical protein
LSNRPAIYRTKEQGQFYYKHPDGGWWIYACVDEKEGQWKWWASRMDEYVEKNLKKGTLKPASLLEFLLLTGTPFVEQPWMSDIIKVFRGTNRFMEPLKHFYVKIEKQYWDWNKGSWKARPCSPSLPIRPSDPAEFEATMGVKFEVPK